MLQHRLGAAIAACALSAFAASAHAAPGPKSASTPCFFVSQWNGWKAPSPNVLYLGVNLHEVYRVDLSAGSSELQEPFAHLISRIRGSDSICSPLDLDLQVSDNNGFREPLIAKSLTKLTPEEVAAIPKKYRPN